MPNAKKNYASRQGDGSGHRRSASITQAVDLSVRQEVQGFGIWYLSVIPGDKTANVCARTFTPPSVVAIFGMWQATHWVPVEPFFVICMFLERGPAGDRSERKRTFPRFIFHAATRYTTLQCDNQPDRVHRILSRSGDARKAVTFYAELCCRQASRVEG